MKSTRLTAEQSSNIIERHRLIVQGVVQGVGFRPFVYGLAAQFDLAGFVGNDSTGVFIEVEGPATALDLFREQLVSKAPPLAFIESLTSATIPLQHEDKFIIVKSQVQATANTLISPDLVTCDDCLQELFDPNNRRYRYPFINCTNCGPRFTIIRDIPYDRPLTTMANFPMCPTCQAEYDDPLDRRFHAQPNACPDCGPQVEFRWSEGQGQNLRPFARLAGHQKDKHQAVILTQQILQLGGIVAVKGLGGFHLACDATNDQAVLNLRHRKGRVDKPFAVMAFDLDTIGQFAHVNAKEAALLTSRERPIVLLEKKANSPISSFVAPGNQLIGVMLPYTPLHYLLLNNEELAANSQSPIKNQKSKILVMTSGNYSSEPIVKDNEVALGSLSGLVDGYLLHNRDIHIQCDDSVIRIQAGQELPIRRSRGYAPFPVNLPFAIPPILAIGGELKSTYCLTKDKHAFMSQHIGDMENWETVQAFEHSVNHCQSLFRIKPELIVADKHPGYLSTKWALENALDTPLVQVQHHHAHIAAVLAEHRHQGKTPVIGFSFDGTGYGSDGAIWGGEVLLTTYQSFERLAHLKYVPLPGGDLAIKRPYRIALAQLQAANLAWDNWLAPVAACTEVERNVIHQQLSRGLNAPLTSSMGRLFDAVASLLGVRQVVTYEGQAAIELEAIAAPDVTDAYHFDISDTAPAEIDAGPIFQAIIADLQAGLTSPIISAKFHNAVADLIVQLSLQMRKQNGINEVALSGGVFQNLTLLHKAVTGLQTHNFTVLTHRLVPSNDGGLALGQAIIGSQIMSQ